EIVARRGGMENEQSFSSFTRRISVRGADVGGIELKLLPLATIAGKVVLEPSQIACEDKGKSSLEEVLISLRPDAKTSPVVNNIRSYGREGAVDDKGEFALYDLDPNRYFITSRPPNESWYVKSIVSSTPPASPASARIATKPSAAADVARTGVALKTGEKLTGITVKIAVGAASLNGKIVAAKEGARVPSRMRVHIVPAEAAAADDVLRYAEATAGGDGSFAFKHLY